MLILFYIFEYNSIHGSIFQFFDYNKDPKLFEEYVDRNNNKW